MKRGYQAMGSGLYAIPLHSGSNGLGTGSHVRLEGELEGDRQRIGSRCARCVRDASAEIMNSLCPVVLVVHLRNDDLRGTS
jgi:hypothetical protein